MVDRRMVEDWYEKLRCPKCGKTGMASLVQPEAENLPAVKSVPDGFKVVKTLTGPDFRCETCNVRVE